MCLCSLGYSSFQGRDGVGQKRAVTAFFKSCACQPDCDSYVFSAPKNAEKSSLSDDWIHGMLSAVAADRLKSISAVSHTKFRDSGRSNLEFFTQRSLEPAV